MAKPPKVRLDTLLVAHGLANNTAEAQSLILAGEVYLDNTRMTKAGESLPADSHIALKPRKNHPWVSRGGLKLKHALGYFNLSPIGKIAADIGSSTGGFTDVLLHHGAAKVYAVDVGYGELAWKLQQDLRVCVLERTNARALTRAQIPDALDVIVCDVSFTRLANVLPAAMALVQAQAALITLVKPQFEVSKAEVGEGGIIRDPELHRRVCDNATAFVNGQPGWRVAGLTESPILGTEGNKEFLLYATYNRTDTL